MKLLEYQAKEVLASLGIAIPPGRVARTPEEAAAACAELGPVAVKRSTSTPYAGAGAVGGIADAAGVPETAAGAADGVRAAGDGGGDTDATAPQPTMRSARGKTAIAFLTGSQILNAPGRRSLPTGASSTP